MELNFDLNSADSYRLFLKVKALPQYHIRGRTAWVPDEYAKLLGIKKAKARDVIYKPSPFLFDYQAGIASIAIRRRKFAIFAKCGMGKTLMIAEWVKHAARQLPKDRRALIVSPINIIHQTVDEIRRFYGDSFAVERVTSKGLQSWLNGAGERIGITNYEAIRPELERGQLGALALDESSLLKSHYGKWGTKLIELGKGLEWKLCSTGTPAPNDRIEYANHAVFLDAFPTVNSFLAKFFVNRGQTSERWELKPHALRPFYLALSHWCIFLSNPAVYGWHDNTEELPPINIVTHDVPLTDEQRQLAYKDTGFLFPEAGGIVSRGTQSQLAKGIYKGERIEAFKPGFVANLARKVKGKTLIWCRYNKEQDDLADILPEAGSIAGDTPQEKREEIIRKFKDGRLRVLISKPKILGFGLNLQMCRNMIFSTAQDSAEEVWQALARANRHGSTFPLDAHFPMTELEEPMMRNVLRKMGRMEEDMREQEVLFKEVGLGAAIT